MLEDIKGIGLKTLHELNKLNINSLEDLLSYYPYRYNYYKPQKINETKNNETIVINGILDSNPRVFYFKKNLNKMTFNINTNSIIVKTEIFNRSFLKNNLKIGKEVSLIGKYNKKQNLFTASDIKLSPILRATMEPVYHLTKGIKKTNFNKLILEGLKTKDHIQNYIPNYLMNNYQFIDKLIAVKNIHNPKDYNLFKSSKLLLTYEELFVFMLKINFLKLKNNEMIPSNIKSFEEKILRDKIDNLPFVLTKDQLEATNEIIKDLKSGKRMNRLLLGDVGTGKTIVAFLGLYINKLSNHQGILMAPTEILAIQHYENCLKFFSEKEMKIALLTSSTKTKERSKIIKDLQDQNIDLLIGTHSVLNDEVKFNNLGLVITDEQHRFGVKQRQNLQKKGKEVDVLYLSATPIPRTLALTIYGDMDISQIKIKPQNNKTVITKVIKEKDIKEVLLKMLEQIKLGYQIYVVVPLIEDDETKEMENVNSIYNKLNAAFNNKIPLDIMHGQLNPKEKDIIMKKFQNNEIKILISTTVIEVGVDVKNATTIVIFNAERFGLATLHQLRGRIGRNNFASYCYLISNHEKERLKIMEKTTDGFEISEKDFELRGIGDLFGIKQSGDMNFKIANLKTDYKILLQCKKDSEDFLNNHLNNLSDFPEQKLIIDSIMFID